jgi:tight adherence protein C
LAFSTIILIAFLFVVLGAAGVGGVSLLFGGGRSGGDRVRELTGQQQAEQEAEREARVAAAIAERIARLAASTDEERQNLLRRKLIHAGYRGKNAPELFNGLRVLLVFVMPLLILPLSGFLGSTYSLLAALGAAGIGYILPMYIVDKRIESRHRKLLVPFPDALDLLVTSVEAGLGLDMAFRRVADEIKSAAPELSGELSMVNYEVAAGVPRLDAFCHLADRTGMDEMKSLVNMMIQAERFGTSIASALRVQADMVRQRRMSRAEEEAAKVSPKLTIVMILFLMPCLMAVLLGPAAIRVFQTFNMVD